MWWCPLLELTVEEVEEDGEIMGGGVGKLLSSPVEEASSPSGRLGRPPKVNPAPSGLEGGWCFKEEARRADLRLTLDPAEGMSVMGACASVYVNVWSSEMVLWGLGKKTDIFRE